MKNLVFLSDKIPNEFSEVETHFTGHILVFSSSRPAGC